MDIQLFQFHVLKKESPLNYHGSCGDNDHICSVDLFSHQYHTILIPIGLYSWNQIILVLYLCPFFTSCCLDLLYFYTNFRIDLPISTPPLQKIKAFWNFCLDCFESVETLGDFQNLNNFVFQLMNTVYLSFYFNSF